MNKLFFRILALVYIALVTVNLIGKEDWHYNLGIADGSIVVKSDIAAQIDTVKLNNLSGPSIVSALVNPTNNNQIILNGNQSYISLDHGSTWNILKKDLRNNKAVWVGDAILIVANNLRGRIIMASHDLGASWSPVTINLDSDEKIQLYVLDENYETKLKTLPLSKFGEQELYDTQLLVNKQGNAVLYFSDKSIYDFELKNNQIYIKEKYIGAEETRFYKDNIALAQGQVPASISVSSDGLWAATQGGVFFKKLDETVWEDKSAALGGHSFYDFVAQRGNKLLILDGVGRLALSNDKGKSWKPVAANVLKAEFLTDDSIVLVQQNGSVLHVDGGAIVEIATNWKLIKEVDEKKIPSYNTDNLYFIHGDKDNVWLTAGPGLYLPNNPVQLSHYEIISNYIKVYGIDEVTVYHYNRKEKTWTAKPWSNASENVDALEDRCELTLADNNVVSINGQNTSDYGVAKKVMLIQSGTAYAQFDDSKVHTRKLNNCKPTGLKKVWDFDEILNPAAYFETDHGLEVVAFSAQNNTTKRIEINLNDTPPLWRRLAYFFYFQYGIYIMGISLIAWFLNIRKKRIVD